MLHTRTASRWLCVLVLTAAVAGCASRGARPELEPAAAANRTPASEPPPCARPQRASRTADDPPPPKGLDFGFWLLGRHLSDHDAHATCVAGGSDPAPADSAR